MMKTKEEMEKSALLRKVKCMREEIIFLKEDDLWERRPPPTERKLPPRLQVSPSRDDGVTAISQQIHATALTNETKAETENWHRACNKPCPTPTRN